MTTPESSAAMTLRRELMATAELAIMGEGVYRPRVIRAERVRAGVIEALFTVEQSDGSQGARLAVIRTDEGQPKVVVHRGFPVFLHRPT